MRLVLGILFVLAVAALLTLAITARPVSSATNPLAESSHTWIAFASTRGGSLALYLMAPDGSNIHRVTNIDADLPVWSPDGKKIAFTSAHNGRSAIYVMNPNGSGLMKVSGDGEAARSPTWSPDGKRIAFLSSFDERAFFMMDADGSNRTRLSKDYPGGNHLSWSPDGKHIAFLAHKGADAIHVMDADGGNVVKLAEDLYDPVWSPDGKLIAADGGAGYGPDIALIDVASGRPSEMLQFTAEGFCPSWSPDGKHIVFASMRESYIKSQIYVMNADGTEQVNISRNRFYDAHPAWSPVELALDSFPMELTPIPPTLTTAPSHTPDPNGNMATNSPLQQTAMAQSTVLLATITAQAQNTKPPHTPMPMAEFYPTQTALKAALVKRQATATRAVTVSATVTKTP